MTTRPRRTLRGEESTSNTTTVEPTTNNLINARMQEIKFYTFVDFKGNRCVTKAVESSTDFPNTCIEVKEYMMTGQRGLSKASSED